MAAADQGKAGVHCGAGHASAGHPGGPGPHRHTGGGYRLAAAQLRGPDGAGLHPPAPGGGHRGGQGARGALWPGAHPHARRV